MNRFIYLIAFFYILSCFNKTTAQTYCYKYIYSIKDDVKIPGLGSKGRIYYFTFTENKERCFSTDKNGVYSGAYGQDSYQFVGKKNGILIYKECNYNMFKIGLNILYFSSDFKRLNWRDPFDDFSPNPNDHGCLRVLEYVSDPNTTDVPSQLY